MKLALLVAVLVTWLGAGAQAATPPPFVCPGAISIVPVYKGNTVECEGPSPTPSPVPTPTATPTPTPAPSPPPSAPPTAAPAAAISYTQTSACIGGVQYTNNGIAGNNGEFDTLGFNRTFWSATQSRKLAPAASWPGLQASWGRFQYDTYFGDISDGSGNDPFTIATDPVSGVQALSIRAEPMPGVMADSPDYGSGYTAANTTAVIVTPAAGGTLTIPANTANFTHTGWTTGIGRPAKTAGSGEDDPQGVVLTGTVTTGGCETQPNGSCTGGSNSVTISGVKYYEGGPGVTIPTGADVQDWDFADYYSGTLDLNLSIEYGFFVARLRTPEYEPAISPAFWTLQTGGVASSSAGLMRDEHDIEEMFANDDGNSMNAGQIHWNTSPSQFSPTPTGVYDWPLTGDPSTAYHDYGALISRQGTTFYLDGQPLAGHTGGPDWTNGAADKELMLMFQVGAPGSWLDPNSEGAKNAWPLYLWSQFIRVYTPTTASCT